MWCSTCQQDVPALGSPSGGKPRCGKCSQPLAESAASPLDSAALERLLSDVPQGEDWALEAELRSMQRTLGAPRSLAPAAVHAPHPLAPAWHAPPAAPQPALEPIETPKSPSHLAAWTILSLGLAVFACGAVLLGWSIAARREDLWPIGLPLALVGQAGLILGLILQLDGLWHTSRRTAKALTQLDGELASVRQATTLLSTSHASGAQSFYFHLAEGASPQLLLADLKGQLDLLAQQMATRKS